MNVAYNMDCMEYMRSLPENAFDLAVCDPPYGDARTQIVNVERERERETSGERDEVRPIQAERVMSTGGGVARKGQIPPRSSQ